jgi:hypothetical protein
MTTAANSRCTSAPGLAEVAMGLNPTHATTAVMSTGRRRTPAAFRTA